MVFPTEINQERKHCDECGKIHQLEVLRSAAGYYIGTQCQCNPYSRESGYFRSIEQAKSALMFEQSTTWRRK